MNRRILIYVYDGFELLDLAGPASVFTAASRTKDRIRYQVVPISRTGGLQTGNGGVAVATRAIGDVRVSGTDTLLLVGGAPKSLRSERREKELLAWLPPAAMRAGRYGSVCTGAYLLAQAGLLDGKRATTHWAALDDLTRRNPTAHLDRDALYVVDGRLWTSAGVSSGIDMALAMVERDLGAKVMGEVARRLVVYARRPGAQSQFSDLLRLQLAAADQFSDVLAWIETNLARDIRVADIAATIGMSERTFHRKFTQAVGITPGKYLDQVRLERAFRLLQEGAAVKTVYREVGYRSEPGFRTAFQARYGVSPTLCRQLHNAA